MSLQAVKAYSNNANGIRDNYGIRANIKKPESIEGRIENRNVNFRNENPLITDKERQFFIKMFPDNSEQLERHIVFNRSGRIQQSNVAKGSIVDSRA